MLDSIEPDDCTNHPPEEGGVLLRRPMLAHATPLFVVNVQALDWLAHVELGRITRASLPLLSALLGDRLRAGGVATTAISVGLVCWRLNS